MCQAMGRALGEVAAMAWQPAVSLSDGPYALWVSLPTSPQSLKHAEIPASDSASKEPGQRRGHRRDQVVMVREEDWLVSDNQGPQG